MTEDKSEAESRPDPPWEPIPSDELHGWAIRARIGPQGSLTTIAALIDHGDGHYETTMVGPRGEQAIDMQFGATRDEALQAAQDALRDLGWDLSVIRQSRRQDRLH